jgi:hypothetical protein
MWSGEALSKANQNKKLHFLLHKDLSHVSMDLISLTSRSIAAKCVAQKIGGKAFADSIAKEAFYFSPYGAVPSENQSYNNLQTDFFQNLPSLDWIHKVSPDESSKISEKWQILKLKIGSSL